MQDQPDPELLERLMREHGAALELFAAQWTSMPEDCVQEVFLQLVRQKEMPQRVEAWLYRVVRNRAISWLRSAKRRKQRETTVATQRESWFTAPGWSNAELEELTTTLKALDESLREVVVARIWGGLAFEQIAEVVGVSKSTVHRRYEAGLQQLRERLVIPWQKNENSTRA